MRLINQLSKETAVPIHTIRYYEQYGLFRGKKKDGVTSNNYTYYDDEVKEKLQLVKEAKELGFSLNEIKHLIDSWYSNRLSVAKKIEILRKKIAEIDSRISQMKSMKRLIIEGIKEVEKLKC